MIYQDFQNDRLSMLGFGAMRLPVNADHQVDEAATEAMIDYAIAHGVNYFDTAYTYHGGRSELLLGRFLQKYPRESFRIADKYPGHMVKDSYHPDQIFEEQLQKCRVDYFDYYLLHNVNENSVANYTDPKWGMIDYFVKQRSLGRIRHLGFSCHARVENLKAFLEKYPGVFDFCQIQLNYLDWTLQHAQEKVDVLNQAGVAIWVMEPLRGGKLAALDEDAMASLGAFRPQESAAGWGFRFLQGVPGIKMILSGMSSVEMMAQNIATFETLQPVNDEEKVLLLSIADRMKDAVPCTRCRYCCEGCPMGLDIPAMIEAYNDLHFAKNAAGNVIMAMEGLPEDKLPHACIGCGACTQICPQSIDVPSIMKAVAAAYDEMPKWRDTSKIREQSAKEAREEMLREQAK